MNSSNILTSSRYKIYQIDSLEKLSDFSTRSFSTYFIDSSRTKNPNSLKVENNTKNRSYFVNYSTSKPKLKGSSTYSGTYSYFKHKLCQLRNRYPVLELNESEISVIARHIKNTDINFHSLEEHIASAIEIMQVESIRCELLNLEQEEAMSLYLVIRLNTTSASYRDQFNAYIDGYLADQNLSQTKIHIDIL